MSSTSGAPERRESQATDAKAEVIRLLLEKERREGRRISRYPGLTQNGCLVAPTSWAQQRLWFIEQLEGAGAAYFIPTGFRLYGQLDVDALRAALDGLVQRHAVLRTVFENLGGEPRQRISNSGALPLLQFDLSALARSEREAAVKYHQEQEVQQRFDLARGPLIRGRLLRLDEREHVLLITMHHIVSDGWSMAVFSQELSALYNAHLEGRENPLPELPIQYSDYAQWQRNEFRGTRYEQQLHYWSDRLRDAPGQLTVPTDRARPPVQSYRGANIDVRFDELLSGRLRAFARHHLVTLFMVLYAGFATLLARLSGQQDIVIGTPTANRLRPEIEGLIGFFVNTLALRVGFRPDTTVTELLQSVKATTLGAYQHQDMPFEKIVEALQPERSLSQHPLFQAMLVLQNAPHSELHLRGTSSTLEPELEAPAMFDLLLYLEDASDEIHGTLSFAADLFDRETVIRWLGYLKSLLGAMADNAQARVVDLPIMRDADSREILQRFNATECDYPRSKLVHELFEAEVQKAPEAIAVIHGDERCSYLELDRRANQLAQYLRAQGVLPGGLVAICVGRTLDMVVGVLAILKAGAAYVPLDPQYPAERLHYMLENSCPTVLLTEQRFAQRFEGLLAPVIALDLEADAIALHGRKQPVCTGQRLSSNSRVYVIYTSGSTGTPKGTEMSHVAMVNLMEWHRAQFDVSRGKRVLQFAALSFDVAFQEIFSTLCTGGTLVLVDEWLRRDPPALVALLCRQAIQRLFLPPLMLQSLAEHMEYTPEGAGTPEAGVGHLPLEDVITAGEALRISPEIRGFLGRIRGIRLHNHYGPTETHVVTSLTLTGNPHQWPNLPTIGRPIANSRIYILDGAGQSTPIGVPGEIHIGGAGVAIGYLARPDLTAARFVPETHKGQIEPAAGSGRVYRTGDLGRWRSDGTIEYLGRNDHQVKIRGFRIELGEIEWQLTQHPNISDAAVVANASPGASTRLTAYVTGRSGGAPETDALRVYLKARIPEYMVPSAIVVLEKFPLTPNGKLDRAALPTPDLRELAARDYEPPQGPVEELIARVGGELLHIARIGRRDNFFELGGHSLLVIQMLERLRREGQTTQVRSVFENPVLADLARVLQRVRMEEHPAVPPNRIPPGCDTITPDMVPLMALEPQHLDYIVGAVPGGAANVQDIYPLAPLQEGLLFHRLMNAQGGDTYVLPTVFAFESDDQLERFVVALQAVIDRHDALRTAVLWERLPQPVQVVYRQAKVPIQTLVSDNQDPLERLRERMRPEHQGLNLRQAPLIRLLVARGSDPRECCALLQIHHLVCDHGSLATIMAEIKAFLEGRGAGLSCAVPYRDHVAYTLAARRTRDAEAYFRGKLTGIAEPTAPFSITEWLSDGSESQQARGALEPLLAERVRTQASRHGVSVATVFHAAWALVVAQTSGREDVVFGTVLLGRAQEHSSRGQCLGMFINTLPLCLRLHGLSARQLIEKTQDELVELLEYEQASLAVAQQCADLGASVPLFTSLLNYRHRGSESESGIQAALGIKSISGLGGTHYPVAAAVDEVDGDYELMVDTDPRISPYRVLGHIRIALRSLLEALERGGTQLALKLPVLNQAELYQALKIQNSSEVESPGELIHELFEKQAASTPDTAAIVYGRTVLSYAELNAKANRLARFLRARGIGPEQLVCLCLERGPELIAAIIAIWKAGAGYVPLDPQHPAARLRQVIEECDPSLLLCEKSTQDKIERSWVTGVCLNQYAEEIAAQSDENMDMRTLGASSSHLAYVIFTSGTTGRPKGVMIEHRNVVNLWQSVRQLYRQPFDCRRVAVNASFTFDASVQQLVQLLSGCTLFVVPPLIRLDPGAMMGFIADQGIEGLDCTPTQLSAWIDSGLLDEGRYKPRTVLVGGEGIRPELWQRLVQATDTTFYNVYGPTECTVDSTATLITAGAARPHVGRPLCNISIHILGLEEQPVAVGVTGEIYIGGAGLARGYLNRADLTKERFREISVQGVVQRLYRSGDLGRWQADGTIEVLGRDDGQVKIRGYRIELGDIEAQLLKHPDVKAAVALARDDMGRVDDLRLVAYIVANQSSGMPSALTAEEMRGYLQAVLPEYMIPSAFVRLDRFPLTSSGKVDKRALPVPSAESFSRAEYEAPRGEVEESLARIWQTVLSVERVGRNDNFFELGGHSLHVMRLNGMVAEHLGVEVGVAAVFQQSTITKLAIVIETLRAEEETLNGGDEFQEGAI